eukprot:scaffold53093_cov81-Phaeocystis_antarctica.AAC.2
MASSAKMLKAVEVYAKRQTPNMTCEVRPTSAAACGQLSQGYKGGVAGRGTCPRSGAGRKQREGQQGPHFLGRIGAPARVLRGRC